MTLIPVRAAVVAAALAATALGGCSFIPAYKRPEPPVAPSYPPAVAAAIGNTGAPAADVKWQDFFGDARLRRLIELSLANNRDLRTAVLNIEQARATYQIRRADLFPTLSGNAGATRTHTPPSLSIPAIPAVGFPGVPTTVNLYNVGVGISSYELDLFGRVRSLSEQALRSYFATDENRKSVQISLIANVASGYLTLLADDSLLKLTRDTLDTRVESLRLSKLRFDSGVASELDYAQAQTLVESARASLVQLQRQRILDENALVLLVGQPIPTDLPTPQDLVGQTMVAEIPAGLPSELLTRRPDIRSLEQQLIGANANIGAARANFFPRIALTGSYGVQSRELSTLFQANSAAWSWGPSLSVPIFDGGRNRANLEVAQVQRDLAVAAYEKGVQTAFREVSDALAGAATLGQQLDALKAQAVAENRRYSLSEMRYKGGVATYLDLLDSQRELFAVQQLVIQTQLAQLQNRVTVYKVLGGGWTDADQANATPPMPQSRVTR